MIPTDQENAPRIRAIAPHVLPGVAVSLATPPTSTPTPARPSKIPAISCPFSRQVLAAIDDNRKTKIGSIAISNDAKPLGTTRSAQCSEPCPTRKKKKPITMLARICTAVGRLPLASAQISRMDPRSDVGCQPCKAGGSFQPHSESPSRLSPKLRKWRKKRELRAAVPQRRLLTDQTI